MSPERILIIEDNKEISKWMDRLCGKLIGHVTDLALDNAQAKNFLETRWYSFIFVDLCIPGGDPIQSMLENLQPDACVLIVSALGMDDLFEAQTKLLDGGFRRVECVQKPICVDDLRKVL